MTNPVDKSDERRTRSAAEGGAKVIDKSTRTRRRGDRSRDESSCHHRTAIDFAIAVQRRCRR
jgi:hypothetical protein